MRLLVAALLLLTLLAAVGGVWVNATLRASLPDLEGSIPVAGLSGAVTVERDALGVPTIQGDNRLDVSRGLGFVHAQDRFFQLDLARRQAAGELSELLGKALLPADRRLRLHRFRWRANEYLEHLDETGREMFEAYTAGVNAGLGALEEKPWEYLLLQTEPKPWLATDSLLVGYSMFLELHDEMGRGESSRGLIYDLLGPAAFDFLLPLGTQWDAPMVGNRFESTSIPPPQVWNPRQTISSANAEAMPSWPLSQANTLFAGSNNWAVAGRHSGHGGAILANDMHLGLAVPNIWYRASLVYPDPTTADRHRRITGVSLPGAPLVVAGSNGEVAWGFTNTEGDWEDLVILETVGQDPDRYLTPDGAMTVEKFEETIRVKSGPDETMEVSETIWGPIIDHDQQGRRRALRWIAHDHSINPLGLLEIESSRTIDEAILAAHRVGAPPQNLVVADRDGRIGWTVMGPIPRRYGHDGRLPSAWSDGQRGWSGWLDSAEYPKLIDPPLGRVWTANNRVIEGDQMALIGVGTFALGARAGQIRDGLLTRERVSEADLLAIQLDDRALFLEPWQQLMLEVLEEVSTDGAPDRQALRRSVQDWGGRASVDSVGYRMVRAFRLETADRVLGFLTAPCKRIDDDFHLGRLPQYEGPLWQLITERPIHMLDPAYHSWHELLQAAVDDTLEYFLADGSSFASHTWGARNTAAIRHPLSQAVPWLGPWLDMPPDPLPGDSFMPRVQGPTFGASERMVVSPGREEQGIFHMPSGQSSHPLSDFFRAGHRDWVEGTPTSFLPGPMVTTLNLVLPTGNTETLADGSCE